MSALDHVLAVLPILPESIQGPSSRIATVQTARLLPLIPRGGFEFPLSGTGDRADLHQLIIYRRGEAARLQSFLEHTSDPAQHNDPAWKALRSFSTWWSGVDPEIAKQIEGIFLEVDTVHRDGVVPSPSIFLTFVRGDAYRSDQAFRLALDLLALLGMPADGTRLETMFGRCRDTTTVISHVGAMLGRGRLPYRINVYEPNWNNARAYLADVGWEGDYGQLEETVSWVTRYVDALTFCIDADTRVYPHIGIECFLDQAATSPERWRRFTETLCERGLSTTERAEFYLGYDHFISPATTVADWPDDLIMENLLQVPDRFSAIFCKPHHVKIQLAPNRPPNAKGYLRFVHDLIA